MAKKRATKKAGGGVKKSSVKKVGTDKRYSGQGRTRKL